MVKLPVHMESHTGQKCSRNNFVNRENNIFLDREIVSIIEYFPYRFEDQGTISTVVKYVYWSKNNLHDEEVLFFFRKIIFLATKILSLVNSSVMSFVEICDFLDRVYRSQFWSAAFPYSEKLFRKSGRCVLCTSAYC